MESKLIISHGDIEGYKKISYYTKRFTKTITFYLEQNYRNVLEVKGTLSNGILIKVKTSENKFYSVKLCRLIHNGPYLEALINEIKILRFVSHPNIIRFYKLLTSPDSSQVVLLLESVGGSLFNIIQDINLTDTSIRVILLQILMALKYLHSCNIIHRLISPENIYIDESYNIKLVNFNYAEEMKGLTSTQGNSLFMAPELLLLKKCSFSSDIWSVACIMNILYSRHHFLTNCTSSNPYYEIAKLLSDSNRKSLLPNGLCNETYAFFNGLLKYDPDERITAEEAIRSPYFAPILNLYSNNHFTSNLKYTSPTISSVMDYSKLLSEEYLHDYPLKVEE